MRHEESGLLDRSTAALNCLTDNLRGKQATPVGFYTYLLWLTLHFATILHSTAVKSLAAPIPLLYAIGPGALLLVTAGTAPGLLLSATVRTVPGPYVAAVAVHD